MSFRQVRNPHMKNNVVTTISGPRYEDEDEELEAAAVVLFGVTIDMSPDPSSEQARFGYFWDHSIA